MNAEPLPILLGGRWVTSPTVLEVRNPARPGTPVGATYLATAEQAEAAVVAAVDAFGTTRRMPAYERGAILRTVSSALAARRDEFAGTISGESGKPIRDALVEVDRATLVLRLGAEEAERMVGETIPLDLTPASRGRIGMTRRFPLGPILGISPFNFPLNLAIHKVAPAIAAGNPIVLKPSSTTPLTMLAAARLFVDAGLPEGALSVLPMDRALGDTLVADERFRMVTFTGSPAVGWHIKRRAGKKKVTLELGGNAGVIVDRDADVQRAALRVAQGAFAFSGQVCISVQRVFAHEAVWRSFVDALVAQTATLRIGDPGDPSTDVGPMIDEANVERIQGWVDEAVRAGATILAGGRASAGGVFPPTILTDVPRGSRICADEAFAPVVVLERVASLEEAIAAVNDSEFGLQAGVFTGSLQGALRAFEELEVGGVVVNDIPTYRADNMPYGGVKESGFGREGLRWAIEDMTEIRIMVLVQSTGS